MGSILELLFSIYIKSIISILKLDTDEINNKIELLFWSFYIALCARSKMAFTANSSFVSISS